jgi:hypothetical protein
VQIARTASDADTLATTIRYAAHPDRRSCGERQDFVTISTDLDVQDVHHDPYDVVVNADPYPTFARLREEAPISQMTHTLPVPWVDPIDISNAVYSSPLMNLVTSQAFYPKNQQPSREKTNA